MYPKKATKHSGVLVNVLSTNEFRISRAFCIIKSMTHQLTPIEQEDLEKRAAAFDIKLKPLLEEFELSLGAVPFITADGRTAARPATIDAKKYEVEGKIEDPTN